MSRTSKEMSEDRDALRRAARLREMRVEPIEGAGPNEDNSDTIAEGLEYRSGGSSSTASTGMTTSAGVASISE